MIGPVAPVETTGAAPRCRGGLAGGQNVWLIRFLQVLLVPRAASALVSLNAGTVRLDSGLAALAAPAPPVPMRAVRLGEALLLLDGYGKSEDIEGEIPRRPRENRETERKVVELRTPSSGYG
jgi:hypothetical protein